MRRRFIPWLLLVLLALGGGAYGWWKQVIRSVVLRHMPAAPGPDALTAVLADHLVEAEGRARSWSKAADGLAELSRLYHANGFYPEAILCYQGLQRIEPRNARWPHLHGALLADFGRLDEALPLRQRAVALAPDYLPAQLRLGDILLKANRPAEAARAYADALKRDSANPYALQGLARCAPATGNTIRRDNDNHPFPEAPDPWLDELVNDCFDAYRLSVAAAIASAAGERQRGLALIDRAVALAPQTASYRRGAAQIMRADGNHEGARRHLEQAVNLDPADSDAWLLLVDTLRHLDQDQAARGALQRGLAHCPQSAGLHLVLAQQLSADGRIPEAILEFGISANLNPADAAPLVEMADLCFATNRIDEGLRALRRALEREPGNPLALTSLTFYHILTNDETAALRHWQEIRRQTRTPPLMLEKLRQAYRQQFDRDLQ